MAIPNIISKYLAKYSLDNWKLNIFNDRLFNNIIVIPVFNENEFLHDLISSLSKNDSKYLSNTLLLFIINNLPDDDEEIVSENQKTLHYLKNILVRENNNLNLGYIDASSKGSELPNKHGGVGFARKIGMDKALQYFDYSNNRKKILICLDADCTVSNNYMKEIVDQFNKRNLNAAILNYEHSIPYDQKHLSAIVNYEIFLRYYVLGLKYACSPFAYHSMGSIIACTPESYVKVGGMNKKRAGEDFYFLEKLAKLNGIKTINGAKVFPSSRISDRVPFGTGPGIKKILDKVNDNQFVYSPESFEVLKKWLTVLNQPVIDYNWVGNSMQEAKNINDQLYNYLEEQNFRKDWTNIISNAKAEEQINRQRINWMDSFRTLKLIHYLRDQVFPNENMFESLNTLFDKMKIMNEFKSDTKIPSLNDQILYLDFLRNLSYVE